MMQLWDGDGRRKDALLSSPRDIENGRAVLPFVSAGGGNEPVIAFVRTSIGLARRRRQFWYASAAAVALSLSGTTGWALHSKQGADRSAEREREAREIADAEAKKAKEAEGIAEKAKDDAVREKTNAEIAAKAEQLAKLQAQAAAVAERQQRAEALRQRDIALASTRVATEQRKLADAQTIETRRQRSRALAQLAEQAIDSGDAMTGILLARSQLQPGDEANWTGAAQNALLHGVLENREVATLTGDTPSNTSAYSPDGTRIVTGHTDGQVLLWNSSNHLSKPIVLGSRNNSVSYVTFSPDGKRILATYNDGTGLVWDISEIGLRSIPLVGHRGSINRANFSKDSQLIITASSDHTARIWRIEGGRANSIELKGHDGWVEHADFSPDGKRAFTLSRESLQLWNLTEYPVKGRPLSGNVRYYSHATFSHDGKYLAAGGWSRSIDIWNIGQEAEYLHILDNDQDTYTNYVLFDKKGDNLFVGLNNNKVMKWELHSDSPRTNLVQVGRESIVHLNISPDGKRISSSSTRGHIYISDTAGASQNDILISGLSSVGISSYFSADGNYLLTNEIYGGSKIWNIKKFAFPAVRQTREYSRPQSTHFIDDSNNFITIDSTGILRKFDENTNIVQESQVPDFVSGFGSYIFSPDGSSLAFLPDRGENIFIWTFRLGKWEQNNLAITVNDIYDFQFSRNGRYFSFYHKNKGSFVYEVGHSLSVIRESRDHVLSFHPDEKSVITTVPRSGLFNFVSLRNNENIIQFRGSFRNYFKAVFSHDGKRIVATDISGKLELLLIDGYRIRSIWSDEGRKGTGNIKFNENGEYFISIDNDGTSSVYKSSEPMRSLVRLINKNSIVADARISRDGNRAVVSYIDGSLIIWTIDSGKANALRVGDIGESYWGSFFHSDEQHVATVSSVGQAKLWYLPTGSELLDLTDQIITRCLTEAQRTQYGFDSPSPGSAKPPCL